MKKMYLLPIYGIWKAMVARCKNPNNCNYSRYGARGIAVCKRWEVFSNFYKDMGDRPDGMSLDRIDNNGDYKPSNCRWATKMEQVRNTRTAKLINGMTTREFERFHKITPGSISNGLKSGKSIQEIINWKPTKSLVERIVEITNKNGEISKKTANSLNPPITRLPAYIYRLEQRGWRFKTIKTNDDYIYKVVRLQSRH